jgi:hypothetical protein
MKTQWLWIIGLLIVALAVAVALKYVADETTPPSTAVSSAETDTIRAVVTEFGTKLQNVSLLASAANRKAAMDENYSAYVAPELLAQWYPEGADALGRSTSSPWPQKIDVADVHSVSGRYVVNGNIIEVANVSGGTAQPVAVQPVTLTLELRDGKWMITKVEKGAYGQLPAPQTIVGTWECLPPKDSTGPHTLECAFGILADKGGHYAIDTRLMSQNPLDFPTGTKVRVTGIVTPAESLNSIQKYDIVGIISVTSIERI